MAVPRIMIVEDEAVVAMEIEQRLKGLGYSVAGAFAYGEQAVEKVRKLNPDVVLMDIKLAGKLDGVQAAMRIRKLCDIPVVYLTAHSDEKTLQSALGAIPLGYVVKPFSEGELHAAIQVCLNKRKTDLRTQESTRCFSRALDAVGGGIILTDEHGIVQNMNNLAERLTGWTAEKALGHPITSICELRNVESGHPITTFDVKRTSGGFQSAMFSSILVAKDRAETSVDTFILPVESSTGTFSNVIFGFREKADGANDAQDWVALSASLLIEGSFCRSDHDYNKAAALYERALEILEAHEGTENSKLRSLLEDLAAVYERIGRHFDAQILAIRAERIRLSSQARYSSVMHGTSFSQPTAAA